MNRKSFYINALSVLFAVVVAPFSSVLLAQENPTTIKANTIDGAASTNIDIDLGYFFGFSFGNMLKEGGNKTVDVEALMRGMQDSLNGKEPALTETQQSSVITAVKDRRTAVQKQQATAQIQDGKGFLEANAKVAGVIQTESGLQYLTVLEGTGKQPIAGDKVVVHYAGRLLNGIEFDSSIKRGKPAEFALNQVIAGWTEGLQLMKVGGKTKFFIPSELAYGPSGTRGIPPHSVLVFDVELLEIK